MTQLRESKAVQAVRQTGFTLIELMVVVAIVAILAAVAMPSYQEQVRKGKRADGKAYLLDLASRQERFYTQFSSYTGVLSAGGCSGAACGLGLDHNRSPEGYYTVTMTAAPSGCSPTGTLCTGYNLTATPRDWVDEKCTSLTLTHAATKGNTGTQATDYCWH